MAKKGILITGGTGLVGAYATGMLLARGERPVEDIHGGFVERTGTRNLDARARS